MYQIFYEAIESAIGFCDTDSICTSRIYSNSIISQRLEYVSHKLLLSGRLDRKVAVKIETTTVFSFVRFVS